MRQSLADDRAEAAEAACAHATQQHVADLLRSRSASLEQEGNGEALLDADYEMCPLETLCWSRLCAITNGNTGQ